MVCAKIPCTNHAKPSLRSDADLKVKRMLGGLTIYYILLHEVDKMFDFDEDYIAIPEKYLVVKDGIANEVINEFYAILETIEQDLNINDLKIKCNNISNNKLPYKNDKITLAKLACTGEIWAFRLIEKCIESLEGKDKEWAVISLYECKRRIEDELYGEMHGIITSGLGGKRDLLRYVTVIKKKYDDTKTYDKIVEVWNSIAKKLKSEVEEVRVEEKYIWIKILVKMDVAVGYFIEEGIKEINKEMDVLEESYLVTNVKIPTRSEIEEYINS